MPLMTAVLYENRLRTSRQKESQWVINEPFAPLHKMDDAWTYNAVIVKHSRFIIKQKI